MRPMARLACSRRGLARSRTGLESALNQVKNIHEEFWAPGEGVNVPGASGSFNQTLEKAGRVADFLEFAQVMIHDALDREESCGGHFRDEYQTEEGEARRVDDQYSYVAAWEYLSKNKSHVLHKENLNFESVQLKSRSYK